MTSAAAVTALNIVLDELRKDGRETGLTLNQIATIVNRLEDVHVPCGEESPDGCSCDRDD